MTSSGRIPRNRLRRIPSSERMAHEYCYFLHDICVAMLVEYTTARAHIVNYKFRSDAEAAQFKFTADNNSAIAALLAIGQPDEARLVTLNTITLAMVSDCLHHIFEALSCMERRKFVVALNLLRKPLTDNLVFLSWMLADEPGFYAAFTKESPSSLSARSVGNKKSSIIEMALSRTDLSHILSADWLSSVLFTSSNKGGLYRLFQHAVHLVTTQRIELQTFPENFNFIFKSPADDDVYIGVYDALPSALLYLTHVIVELFNRMRPMDTGTKGAISTRSIFGFHLVERNERLSETKHQLTQFTSKIRCATCQAPISMTDHNVARIVMNDSFRCSSCQRVTVIPFSWMF